MPYTLHYHIIAISYFDSSRVTRVDIVNESTGEIFSGIARRNPHDEMIASLGINLATLRAVRKAIVRDLADDEGTIVEEGSCFDFEY